MTQRKSPVATSSWQVPGDEAVAVEVLDEGVVDVLGDHREVEAPSPAVAETAQGQGAGQRGMNAVAHGVEDGEEDSSPFIE